MGAGVGVSLLNVYLVIVLLTVPYECNYLFKTKNKNFNVKKEDG